MKKIPILTLFLIIIIYILILIIPRNYKTNYKIDKKEVIEKYNKKDKIYTIIIKYKNKDYPLIYEGKYKAKRKLVTNIKTKNKKDTTCLEITVRESKKIICTENEELIDYRLTNLYKEETSKTKVTEYKNTTIYNKEYQYLLWNYKGYISIGDKNTTIDIFENEKYNNINTFQTNKYLIIPDYDSNYYYKNIYLYNCTKNKVTKIESNYEISYTTLYQGEYKNKAYFLDLKNGNQYEINLTKSKIRLLNEKDNNGLFLKNNKLVKHPVKDMIKNNKTFPTNNVYKYKIINNYLYQIIEKQKIKITDKEIKDIITIINDTIFYLVDDTVYSYNYQEGEKILLKQKEWKFNYHNQIFIFNKSKN